MNLTGAINLITLPVVLVTLLIAPLLRGHNFFVVDAIKCYVCQSNVDPKCADPFDNLTLPITDCDAYPRADLVPKTEYDLIDEKSSFFSIFEPAPAKPLRATMCRKIRQKVNGEWRTVRGCGYLPASLAQQQSGGDLREEKELNCQVRHGTYDIFVETCACNNKDGCNGSTGLLGEPLAGVKLVTWLLLTLTALLVSRKLAAGSL